MQMSKNNQSMVRIVYINKSNAVCEANIRQGINHSYWTSKKNCLGKYDKIEVDNVKAFLNKLKGCKIIEIVEY